MGSWSEDISGMTPPELDSITHYLKRDNIASGRINLYRQPGNSTRGEELYNSYCRTCHGKNGEGSVAVALNQADLLNRAGDRFLMATLLNGRGNTAMPAWSILRDDQLMDLVSFLSSRRTGFVSEEPLKWPEADPEQGALQYHFLCSRCHGEHGEGETGPAIINRDFLNAASDRFLHETIAMGRSHTAMFGWSADVYNQEKLNSQDISNIIGHLRKSSLEGLSYIYQGRNPGEYSNGAVLFEKHCAQCHGKSGDGVKAPALHNQEFLSAASNGYLLATITVGRTGTSMPSWGYGDKDHPLLSGKDRLDLVAYIRTFQRIHIKY
jgi:mono/diheme cytochrome c family protein